MNFEDKKINQILQKALESNLIKLDSADITYFKKLSDNWSLKPLKNKKLVGVIIYFEFGDNHTLDDINSKAEEILKPLPDDINAVWAGNKGTSKELITTTIYLYDRMVKRVDLTERTHKFAELFDPKGYLIKKSDFEKKLAERFSVLKDKIIEVKWREIFVDIEYANKSDLKKVEDGVYSYKYKENPKLKVEEDIIKELFGIKEDIDEFLILLKLDDDDKDSEFRLLKSNALAFSVSKYKDNLYYYIKVTRGCKVMI